MINVHLNKMPEEFFGRPFSFHVKGHTDRNVKEHNLRITDLVGFYTAVGALEGAIATFGRQGFAGSINLRINQGGYTLNGDVTVYSQPNKTIAIREFAQVGFMAERLLENFGCFNQKITWEVLFKHIQTIEFKPSQEENI